jgi:hypothetical protein
MRTPERPSAQKPATANAEKKSTRAWMKKTDSRAFLPFLPDTSHFVFVEGVNVSTKRGRETREEFG